ncbi:MAG: cupin domain-containing protein [Pseudomonadota bacterium]
MANSKYILKAGDIAAMDGLHKIHFINPEAERINKSLGDHTGLTGLGFHIIEVPSGKASTEYHKHYFEDECAYVLSGKGMTEIEDEMFEIGPGDFIAYPKDGPAHRIINTSDAVLRCIVVGERLAHDVGDYPRMGKRIYRNAGQDWDLVDIDVIDHPTGGQKK